MSQHEATDTVASPTTDSIRKAGLGAIVLGGALYISPATTLWIALGGLCLAFGAGVPLLAWASGRPVRALLPGLVVLVAVVGAWAPYARATSSADARDRNHDGGVYVTRAAADHALHGRNPYTATYEADLPPSWAMVQGAAGEQVDNPVRDHMPYLPLAFLVHVPFVAAADALSLTWDPRVLSWAALIGVCALLARRRGQAWARLGAILVVANAYAFTYLAWGTNDVLAVCAFVATLLFAAADRPGRAGAALAVAISCKFLFLVALAPLAIVVWHAGGRPALRRWWTLPAVLLLTCVPYLILAPKAFLDDVVWFNLGMTDPKMPISGLGLPAVAPGIFHGTASVAATIVGALVAFALVPWLARRRPSIWAVGPLASLGLLGVLVPARTFQTNYLVLVVASAATGWFLAGGVPGDVEFAETPEAASVG